MKAKVLTMCLAVTMLMQSNVMALSGHKHTWMDDVEHSDAATNRYYCDCGETKDEIAADIRDYVITFDPCGGFVEETQAKTKKNRLRKMPIPEHTSDYQWEGWYTEPDGGELVTEDWLYEQDTTLYARWIVTGTYTLTFASDGGSYIRPVTALYGSIIDLANYVPEKDGCIFRGWYTDPRTKTNEVKTIKLTQNEVLYAKWETDAAQKQPDRLLTTDTVYLTDAEYAERVERLKAIVEQFKERLRNYMRYTEGASDDASSTLYRGCFYGG